jgi:hypothetical protein
LSSDDRFTARPAPGRIFLLLLGSIGFVVLGLWMVGAFGEMPNPSRAWAGWLCIPFFGACAVGLGYKLFDRHDQIVVDQRGIYWRRWSPQTIAWDAIAAIEPRRVQRQDFLCLHLVDPSRFPSTTLLGRLAGMNRGMGFGDIAINTVGTDKKLAELEEAVARFAPTRLARLNWRA